MLIPIMTAYKYAQIPPAIDLMTKFQINPIPTSNMPRDDVEDSGFIFNQLDWGLAVKTAKGESVELADISLICRNPISTHDLKLKGYLWLVQYNRKNKIQKSVFIEKKANMKPAVFEQAIDSQHGLAFRMDIGR